MIHVNELRIGNIIKFRTKPELLVVDIDLLKRVQLSPILFDGVRLNNELIERLGFVLNHEKGFDRGDAIKVFSNEIDISFEYDDFNLWFEVDEDNWYNFKSIKLQYVHQLQNVFLDFTQKQLKLQ